VEVEVVEDMVAAAAEVEVVTMAAMLLKLIIIIKLNFYNDIWKKEKPKKVQAN
jgi:hypothetical protein